MQEPSISVSLTISSSTGTPPCVQDARGGATGRPTRVGAALDHSAHVYFYLYLSNGGGRRTFFQEVGSHGRCAPQPRNRMKLIDLQSSSFLDRLRLRLSPAKPTP